MVTKVLSGTVGMIDGSSLSELEPSPANDLEQTRAGCEVLPLASEFGRDRCLRHVASNLAKHSYVFS
jgi:hypothetical protein